MTQIGVTLGGEPIARWLDTQPDRVGCVEIAAEGFFARPTPHLSWLGAHYQLFIRATALSIGSPGRLDPERLQALVEVCDAANARAVVHPLGFRQVDDLVLPALTPISLTSRSLEDVAGRVAASSAACRRPAFVEPIASPLRVPGSLGDTEFLIRLGATTGARLLIDLPTLLVSERNHGIVAEDWLGALPPDLVGAVRIGGCAHRRGRWHRDPTGEIDEAAWALLDGLVARGGPELFLLDHEPEDGLDVVVRELERMDRAATAKPTAAVPAGPDSATPVRASGDVALFVLDREGVFFSAPRRELSLFNTAATLVWCLIDEGQSVPAIVEGYARAFGLAPAEARRHVSTMLQQWYGRGYIEDPGPLDDAPEVPLTAAIAQLLTNPRLRNRFRQSPHWVAGKLGVAADDTIAFTALNADQLDAQAEELTEAVARLEAASPPGGVDCRPARPPSTPLIRHYRLLSTTFALDAGSPELSDRLSAAMAHLECPDLDPDVVLELRRSMPGGWTVTEGDTILADHCDDAGVVPAVKQLVRRIAVDRHPFLVSVHAGVVSFANGCVLLPAAAGSGKTTLTAALVRAGATYYSDEIALLETATLAVTPVPLALTVKDGALGPLRPLFPSLDSLPVHVREDQVRVRYLMPPPASIPGRDAREAARWIVFPRYDPAAETALVPIDRPAALRRLLEESFVAPRRLDKENVESLVQWMRNVECFELPVSALDTAVALLRALAGPAGGTLQSRS